MVKSLAAINHDNACFSFYDKFRDRKSIDFSIVSLAGILQAESGRLKEARLVLGSVAPIPIVCREAEAYLEGKEISEDIAEEAAELALKKALPHPHNQYKINIAKAMIKRAVLGSRTEEKLL